LGERAWKTVPMRPRHVQQILQTDHVMVRSRWARRIGRVELVTITVVSGAAECWVQTCVGKWGIGKKKKGESKDGAKEAD